MFSRHVTKDISAYCHGELSNEESKQFAEHIISCIKCRTKFEEIKLGVKLAEQLPQLTAPDHLWSELEPLLAKQHGPQITQISRVMDRGWSWQLKVAAAAVLLLVSSLGAWWLYNRGRKELPGRTYWQVTTLDGRPT